MDWLAGPVVGIIGTIGTLFFGGLSLWQWHKSRLEQSKLQQQKQSLTALSNQLRILRGNCMEMVEIGLVLKDKGSKAFVHAVARTIHGLESAVDALLGSAEKHTIADDPFEIPAGDSLGNVVLRKTKAEDATASQEKKPK